MDWGSVVSGLFTGATTGPIGLLFGGAMAYFKKRQSDKHELTMAELQDSREAREQQHDLALADKEIEGAMAIGKMKLDEVKFATDSAGLSAASSSQDSFIPGLESVMQNVYPWMLSLFIAPMFAIVTAAQKLVRIVITVYLVWMVQALFNDVQTLVGLQDLPKTELLVIFKMIVGTILNLVGMAVGFWFVSRFDVSKAKVK